MAPAWRRSRGRTTPCARTARKADATRRVLCRRRKDQLQELFSLKFSVDTSCTPPSSSFPLPCRRTRRNFSHRDNGDNTSKSRPIAASCWFRAVPSGNVQPILRAGQRRLAVGGGFVIFQRWRQNGKAFPATLRDGDFRRLLFPNYWERLAPVTLTAEQPVAQFVIDGFFAETFFFEPDGDFLFGFGVGRPVMEISVADWIHEMPSSVETSVANLSFLHRVVCG